MIPFSQRTYYPTIRGIAKTNATVEVRQNGYLIYSTSVPPGQFEIGREQIADLGVGVGVLDVSIYEKKWAGPKLYSAIFNSCIIFA